MSRRLRFINVVNFAEPVELHELFVDRCASHLLQQRGYESALTEFETGHYAASVGILGKLLNGIPNDLPAGPLLWHAAHALVNPHQQVAQAWELPSK